MLFLPAKVILASGIVRVLVVAVVTPVRSRLTCFELSLGSWKVGLRVVGVVNTGEVKVLFVNVSVFALPEIVMSTSGIVIVLRFPVVIPES